MGKTFRTSEMDAGDVATLAEMLDANPGDIDLHDWCMTADVGAMFVGIVSVERVS